MIPKKKPAEKEAEEPKKEKLKKEKASPSKKASEKKDRPKKEKKEKPAKEEEVPGLGEKDIYKDLQKIEERGKKKKEKLAIGFGGKKKKEPSVEKYIDPADLNISKILLYVGILLCAAGIIGVVGLRVGFIQALLGDASPYPGIGTVEPNGHIVSVIPFVMGLLTIFVWGLKSDPIYYEKEKMEEELKDEEEDEEDILATELEVPEEFKEPVIEREEKMMECPTCGNDVPASSTACPECGEQFEEGFEDIESLEDLDEAIGEIAAEEAVAEAEPEKIEEPEPVEEKPKEPSKDDLRMQECNEILADADIYDEDRTELEELIPTDITVKEFSKKVDEAVEKKKVAEEKKKEEYEKMDAEEKGRSLEDELAAELAALEDELEEDDDEDLEERILREIEDLENL